jgi:hypothetical protein
MAAMMVQKKAMLQPAPTAAIIALPTQGQD